MRTWTPPQNASVFFGGFDQSGPAQRTFGLFVAALHPGRGPVMEMRGSGPNRPGELSGSSHIPGCPDPVSRTVCPYPSSGLPTFLPALSVRPLLRREAPVPCRPPCSASAPRRCARSYWPAPPRRASSACAPTSGRATNPAATSAGQPSADIAPVINSRTSILAHLRCLSSGACRPGVPGDQPGPGA